MKLSLLMKCSSADAVKLGQATAAGNKLARNANI